MANSIEIRHSFIDLFLTRACSTMNNDQLVRWSDKEVSFPAGGVDRFGFCLK